MKKILFYLTFFLSINANAQDVTLSLEKFGAHADGTVLQNASIAGDSKILTCNYASFTSADIGKTIYIAGAADNNNTLTATVFGLNASNSVTISKAAATTVNNANVTYGTDCTNAFINWNNAARAQNGRNIVLNMQHGTYLTSFNNWLAGIKNVSVNGNGCNVICTHGALYPLDSPDGNCGMFMPSCFTNLDNRTPSNKLISDNSYGFKIKSNLAGKAYVQTISAADAGNFTEGNWVLIYGLHHEDFGGFPPDPRYFEYAIVKSIDRTHGIIYLNKSLENAYDEGWPDGILKSGVGAPRILSLDRSGFTTIKNLKINNINFLPFNGWTGKFADEIRNGRFEVYGYINATIKNVTASAAYLGQGKHLIVDGATFKYQCEPDKVLDSTIVRNSNIKDFVNAGGVNFLHLVNNNFMGEFNASPHVLFLDSNTFNTRGANSTSMASIGFNKGTYYIKVGTNTWNSGSAKITTLFSEPGSTKLTVGSVLNNNTIIIPYADFVANKNSRQVIPGSTGYSVGGNKLKVLRVYKYDDADIAVTGNFSQVPVQGDIFEFSFEPKIDIAGKQIKTGQFKSNASVFKSHTKVYTFNSVDIN